jgi:hypothetical protein
MLSTILVEADAKSGGDVEIMRLADQTDGGRACVHHGGQHVVIGGRAPCPLGHAKGGQDGAGLGAASKNALSVGFAPGQPPSI